MMVELLKKVLNLKFEEAVKHIEKTIIENGFSHIITKNMHETIKTKLGINNYPKYTLILACGAEFARAALDISRDIGLLFPCSFTVYEDEGKVWVSHISIMKVAAAIGLAPEKAMQPVIEMAGTAVKVVWEKL